MAGRGRGCRAGDRRTGAVAGAAAGRLRPYCLLSAAFGRVLPRGCITDLVTAAHIAHRISCGANLDDIAVAFQNDGIEALVRIDFERSLLHYERAVGNDSTYPMPLIAMAIAYTNMRQWARADSVARRVALYRDRLGPLEVATLDMLIGLLDGADQAA